MNIQRRSRRLPGIIRLSSDDEISSSGSSSSSDSEPENVDPGGNEGNDDCRRQLRLLTQQLEREVARRNGAGGCSTNGNGGEGSSDAGGGRGGRGGVARVFGGSREAVKSEDSDESDVEDPNFLKNMCKGFTSKIKEKNDTISVYKKVLFNSHLQMVKMEAAHQRKLRKILLGSKISNFMERRREEVGGVAVNFQFGNGEQGKDPLLVFPEEIWVMILQNVTDVKDIRSCSKACQLFERILEETKTQWLFEKTFPFIFNLIRRKDVLNCRKVCKSWSSGVDNFLANYYTIMSLPGGEKQPEAERLEETLDQPNLVLKSFHYEYNFSIPPPPPEDLDSSDSDSNMSTPSSQASINRCHDRVREKMRLHERNPFIGRSVTIEEDSADFERVEAGHPADRTFVSQAKLFLKDFGIHIWHLSICCNMEIQTPSEFYKICLQSLIECKNLRTLCLGADLNWRLRRTDDIAQINQHPPPIDSPHLESLQMEVDSPKIFIIQDKLIEKYCNQLKRLELQMWNSGLYYTFQWSSLRELQINKGSADDIVQNLRKLKAPNLRKLCIRLDGRGPYLQALLELTNHFPKLAHLEIKFESRFGGMSEDEMLSLPAGLTSSSNLVTLELTSSVTDLLSYNFLMYFPFLQRLLIRHGHWTTYNLLDATAPYFTHLQQASFKAIKKNEMVKIAKYIMQDGLDSDPKLMYKSNVWGMLPFLQCFELCNARYVPEKRKVFTRQGYEHFQKSQDAPL